MSNFKIVFVHGYTASSGVDFYPDLSQKLDKYGIDYCIPDLPGDVRPYANEWLEKIHDILKDNKKPLIFVGHSLGTRTVLLYLEKYQQKAEKVFLIAAFANRVENALRRGGKAYRDFFTHKINIENVKKLVGTFYVVHSKDDGSINYSQGEEIAKDLGAKLITIDNRDHFSEPENASYIFNLLKKELKF